MQYQVLTGDELDQQLAALPDWEVKQGALSARFILPDFRSAIALINMVATEAEAINHHPTYTHSFRMIDFTLSTHDVGGEITLLDCKLAGYISDAGKRFAS